MLEVFRSPSHLAHWQYEPHERRIVQIRLIYIFHVPPWTLVANVYKLRMLQIIPLFTVNHV